MWICRAGYKAKYFEYFIKNKKIYLAWEGFNIDLNDLMTVQDIRDLVSKEMGSDNHTSISNWSGQLIAFRDGMCVDDYVVIPNANSHTYTLAKIAGDYTFEKESLIGLHHSRRISLIKSETSKEAFTQNLRYSMGAYRTVFKAKEEEKILDAFQKWNK